MKTKQRIALLEKEVAELKGLVSVQPIEVTIEPQITALRSLNEKDLINLIRSAHNVRTKGRDKHG
ncbi:hypothetical protein [Sporomusa malonica]|uniref:Uncharacterized protein n=1 Tax=Sporomusa malonica TaxID=112901 RepID=A0A1W2AU72_9FIRM|nr:hypothetical protein [Sporomusa malonica]SMC64277.1 hypothetical protein SAMN04488500_106127 [Sporomusa malonica]